MHLYVYYQVPAADAAATMARVHAMQARLVTETSVAAHLQRRVDEASNADGTQTWMEIYPEAPGGFEDRLAAAVAASGLEPGVGPRRVERFEDVA